jgi:hypothetical protein
MTLRKPDSIAAFLILTLAASSLSLTAQTPAAASWKPLFNGKNLDGWFIRFPDRAKNEDPNKLVQVADGSLHFYKDAEAGSPQPFGYIATEKEYTNYKLRFEFKWGTKKFAPRVNAVRDSGLLIHTTSRHTDRVWPDSLEYQIQENDVGDIYAISTRVITPVDPQSTNVIVSYTTNRTTGAVRTNSNVRLKFLPAEQGGVEYLQGRLGTSMRIIRNPLNEREGWNTVEVEVRGDRSVHSVNGKVNNSARNLQQMLDGQWKPLTKGFIALQLEGAEILYRNIEVMELPE